MKEKLAEISSRFPKVKTRLVVFDFEKQAAIQDYKTGIADKIKDIDIAILFLNAGYARSGPFSMILRMDV